MRKITRNMAEQMLRMGYVNTKDFVKKEYYGPQPVRGRTTRIMSGEIAGPVTTDQNRLRGYHKSVEAGPVRHIDPSEYNKNK